MATKLCHRHIKEVSYKCEVFFFNIYICKNVCSKQFVQLDPPACFMLNKLTYNSFFYLKPSTLVHFFLNKNIYIYKQSKRNKTISTASAHSTTTHLLEKHQNISAYMYL